MKDFLKFLFFEAAVFLMIGMITFFEINNFGTFESVVSYIKIPASWFIGLSLAFIFSYIFQNLIVSFFRREIAEEEKRKDFFMGFVIAVVITSFITPGIRQITLDFFGSFLPYFHLIMLQAIIIFYLLFKINGKYEISGRYFLTNQLIVLLYTAVVLFTN